MIFNLVAQLVGTAGNAPEPARSDVRIRTDDDGATSRIETDADVSSSGHSSTSPDSEQHQYKEGKRIC